MRWHESGIYQLYSRQFAYYKIFNQLMFVFVLLYSLALSAIQCLPGGICILPCCGRNIGGSRNPSTHNDNVASIFQNGLFRSAPTLTFPIRGFSQIHAFQKDNKFFLPIIMQKVVIGRIYLASNIKSLDLYGIVSGKWIRLQNLCLVVPLSPQNLAPLFWHLQCWVQPRAKILIICTWASR